MGFTDALNYALFNNPISSGTAHYTKSAANSVSRYFGSSAAKEMKKTSPTDLYKLAAHAGPFMRIAGLSGAIAVIIAAYGSHNFKVTNDEKGEQRRKVFDTASRYHFIHTLSLLSLPLVKHPFVIGTLFISGILLFCGPCYYSAFTGDKTYNRLTPVGGFCFIFGWLVMCI